MKTTKLNQKQINLLSTIVDQTNGSMMDMISLMIDQTHLGTTCKHCISQSIRHHYNKQVLFDKNGKPNYSEPMMEAIRMYMNDFIIPYVDELYPKIYEHLTETNDLFGMDSALNYQDWVGLTIDELQSKFDIDYSLGFIEEEELEEEDN